MSNEEKILELLQGMQTDMRGMQTDIREMKTEIREMKTEIRELKTRQADLEAEIKASESRMIVMMESKFKPDFNALSEKVDAVAEDVAKLKKRIIPEEEAPGTISVEDRVGILEVVVKQHSQEIQKLQKAQ